MVLDENGLKTNDENYYKANMFYYRGVLGIAHAHLTMMGIIFRNENLSPEEKLEAIKKRVFTYKEERKNYPDPIVHE